MKTIQFDAHRQQHFNHFNGLASPHFGVTVNVDITELLDVVRRSPTLRFTPAIVYLITRTALEVQPFRWRIRGCKAEDEESKVEVVEHETLRPSWAVPTKVSSAFSFCTVGYDPDPLVFHQAAVAKMEQMKTSPTFTDEQGADDYLFLSTFPWASFTSVTHAMPLGTKADSVPRIVWGKYFHQGDKALMPLAVQGHHAVVDGSDLGRYFQLMQQYLKKSATIFELFMP